MELAIALVTLAVVIGGLVVAFLTLNSSRGIEERLDGIATLTALQRTTVEKLEESTARERRDERPGLRWEVNRARGRPPLVLVYQTTKGKPPRWTARVARVREPGAAQLVKIDMMQQAIGGPVQTLPLDIELPDHTLRAEPFGFFVIFPPGWPRPVAIDLVVERQGGDEHYQVEVTVDPADDFI